MGSKDGLEKTQGRGDLGDLAILQTNLAKLVCQTMQSGKQADLPTAEWPSIFTKTNTSFPASFHLCHLVPGIYGVCVLEVL
jgi:hypothetical protein